MKPCIRLAVCDFWPAYNAATCPILSLLRTRFDVRLCDDPEFVLYSNCGEEHTRYKCVRIFFSGENKRPPWYRCDWAFTFERLEHPRHFRWPLYATGYYGELRDLVKREIDAEGVLRSKTRFCNFVVSNSHGAFRNRFFDRLSKYKRIDAPGRVRHNMGGLRVEDKRAFVRDYKFTLAFENNSRSGYSTEKITDPMFALSVPIYWGDPQIGQEFNTRSFLSYHDHRGVEDFVERIIAVDRDDSLYLECLRQPWLRDNKPPEAFCPEAVLEQFERVFSTKVRPVATQPLRVAYATARRSIKSAKLWAKQQLGRVA